MFFYIIKLLLFFIRINKVFGRVNGFFFLLVVWFYRLYLENVRDLFNEFMFILKYRRNVIVFKDFLFYGKYSNSKESFFIFVKENEKGIIRNIFVGKKLCGFREY